MGDCPLLELSGRQPARHLVLQDQGHQEDGASPGPLGDLRRNELGLGQVLYNDGPAVHHHRLVESVAERPESALGQADLASGGGYPGLAILQEPNRRCVGLEELENSVVHGSEDFLRIQGAGDGPADFLDSLGLPSAGNQFGDLFRIVDSHYSQVGDGL